MWAEFNTAATANPKGMTPLILSAITGQADACTLLLAKGARADIKDKKGRTALMYAVKLGRDTVQRRLTATTYD